MGANIENEKSTVPGLEGWEALNKQSALHKALTAAQHWHRAYTVTAQELGKLEDRRILLYIMSTAAFVGWGLFFVAAFG